MKKIALLLTIAIIVSIFAGAFPISASASAGALIGDVDKDGGLTVSDSLLTLRAAAGLYEYDEEEKDVLDVWADGEVGADDALGIMRSSLGIIGSFGRTGVALSFAPNTLAQSAGVTQTMLDRAIVSAAGSSRIAKVMQKAARGEKINFVTLGGSITYGSGASSTTRTSYAALTAEWLRNAFPQARINFHNSGIGATGSMLGVHRLERDVFRHDADLLIVEFAVNDNPDGTQETYENLIRRVVTQSPDTAVIMLFMTTEWYNDKQYEEVPVGSYYGIPMISYRDAIKPECDAGRYTFKPQLSDDGTHPNDFGYSICAGLITSYLEGVKNVYADHSTILPDVPSEPLTSERYMNAKMYWCGEGLEPTSLGSWTVDNYTSYDFVGSWVVSSGTRPMIFDFEASNISILYERRVDLSRTGKIKITVDSGGPQYLDSYFENGWGNYKALFTVMESDVSAPHKLRIARSGGEFRLMAILLS